MKDQLKIQEMHNQSGKFGKPVKSIEEKLTGSMRGKSKIPQFIIGDGKKEETQIWIDELVDSLVGVKSLEQSYQAASELEMEKKRAILAMKFALILLGVSLVLQIINIIN